MGRGVILSLAKIKNTGEGIFFGSSSKVTDYFVHKLVSIYKR